MGCFRVITLSKRSNDVLFQLSSTLPDVVRLCSFSLEKVLLNLYCSVLFDFSTFSAFENNLDLDTLFKKLVKTLRFW